MVCWRRRNEPDHCGKVILTQRHRTDKELPLVNSAVRLQQSGTHRRTVTHTYSSLDK